MKNTKIILLLIIFLLTLAISVTGCTLKLHNNQSFSHSLSKNQDIEKTNKEHNANQSLDKKSKLIWHLKDIPTNISDSDLDLIATSGFKILMPEWGIDDVSLNEVTNLLDRLEKRKLKIVLDAGFTDASWDFNSNIKEKEDGKHSPFWLSEKVAHWVNALKNHPAVYGWDISNEAGENMTDDVSFRITLNQLKTAAKDVRSFDNTRPIIIRMHYWDEYDSDFGVSNPFAKGIADIVILNLYSNYSIDGKNFLLPNMIADSAQILENKIRTVDPNVDIWISLATYSEPPMFLKPTPESLNHDIVQTLKLNNIQSIGFFGWGNPNSDWYLPRDGIDLFKTIKKNIKNIN